MFTLTQTHLVVICKNKDVRVNIAKKKKRKKNELNFVTLKMINNNNDSRQLLKNR